MTSVRFKPRLKHLLPDLLIMAISLYLGLYLRVGNEGFEYWLPSAHRFLGLILVIRLVVFYFAGIYNILWRYVSAMDSFRLAQAMVISTGLILAASFLTQQETLYLPRSVYFIEAFLSTVGLMGIRILRRLEVERRVSRFTQRGHRTLIYGAGVNGKTLAERFRSDFSQPTHVVGFIDDDRKKQGLAIANVRVMGGREALGDLIEQYEITQLVVAIPQLVGQGLRDVVMVCAKHGVRLRLTTPVSLSDKPTRDLNIVREVELNDLLNRPSREIDLRSISQLIQGKTILVTGAGGSIGSELARQALRFNPAKLLLLDHSEYALFEIDKELRAQSNSVQHIVPLLVDLKETNLFSLLNRHVPQVVLHAAAYKHVHLVETNPQSAVLNNVAGTKNLLEASQRLNVDVFLMISTDKAVNPRGVMGATKRVCELMVTASALQSGRRYSSVRFGNVLGSSGSLIPTLKQQILEGGPVTVTHPDMTRYFMLIPEAVSLVLKAATMAKPGDINILKMGEPVKIVDIARNLIALSGKTEDEVPIAFTGIRPGEKLFEELYLRGDELATDHPDIVTLRHGDSDLHLEPRQLQNLNGQVEQLITWAAAADEKAVSLLHEMIKTAPTTASDFQGIPLGTGGSIQ